jgi:phosphoheptose isomerase
MKQTIKNEFLSHLEVINLTIETMQEKLEQASLLVVETLRNGNKVLLLRLVQFVDGKSTSKIIQRIQNNETNN